MSKYVAILRASVRSAFIYRWGVFLEVIAEILTSFFAILIWKHVGAGKGAGGFEQGELLTYLVLAGFIISAVNIASSGDEADHLIRDGELSLSLTKPWNMGIVFFMQSLGEQVLMILSAVVGYGVIILSLRIPVFAHLTWVGVVQALPFLLMGLVLQFLILHATAFLAFWLDQTWGPRLLVRLIMEIGSGALIPLSLIHPAWRGLFTWLPFRFMGDAPTLALLGRLGTVEYGRLLLVGISWMIVCLVCYTLIWRRGVKSYEAVGN